MELTPDQQCRLYEDIETILSSISWTDVAQLTALVMGNATLQQQVTAALLSYIQKELQAEVHYVDWRYLIFNEKQHFEPYYHVSYGLFDWMLEYFSWNWRTVLQN